MPGRDAESLAAVLRAAYAVEADLIGWHGIPLLHATAESAAAADLTWVGVRADDRLVGALGYRHEGDLLDIHALAVEPGSARRGLGRLLVRHVLDLDGTQRWVVGTAAANDPAVSLYLSEGFHATERRSDPVDYVSFERTV